MAKRRYEITFYYSVTIYRDAEVEIEVPDDAAPDFNPFDGKQAAEVLGQYEESLGDPRLVDEDENPSVAQLEAVLLEDLESETLVLSERDERNILVSAPIEDDEDEA